MITKEQLEANADAAITAETADTQPGKIEQFCMLWTGTVKPALQVVKIVTGKKIDKLIDDLEKAADRVCEGDNPDVENYCTVWNNLHLKGVLRAIQWFTGPKVDKALNKFIELSDDLCAEPVEEHNEAPAEEAPAAKEPIDTKTT